MSAFPHSTRLPSPVCITEQFWPEGTVPVVSIFCITYNHVNFIRDAIEGFLMQETTFPVGIFIHDDASTDGTAEIVKEYAEKYPRLFWTILQTENQWSKGNKKPLFDYLACQHGEFIALCEGDDYWTQANKLEKQVYILEGNPELSFVFHKAYEEIVGNALQRVLRSNFSGKRFQFDDMFKYTFAIPTASMLYRKNWLQHPEWLNECLCGDRALQLLLLDKGPAAFVNGTWSVYRTHSGGLTRMISENYATTVIPNWISMYHNFDKFTESRHQTIIEKEITRLVGERSRFQIYALNQEHTEYQGNEKIPQQMICPERCRQKVESMMANTFSHLKEPLTQKIRSSQIFSKTLSAALISAGDAWYVRKHFAKANPFYLSAASMGDGKARFYCLLLRFGVIGRVLRSVCHRLSFLRQKITSRLSLAS